MQTPAASLGRSRRRRHERRLTRRDRWALAALTLLSVASILVAAGTAAMTTLTFFGDVPTGRQEAIADHAGRAVLWSLVTPLCGWVLLRRSRRAWFLVGGWLGLLAWCSWWWWPTPPTGWGDTDQPLWHTKPGVVGWLLAAAGLVLGLRLAWRTPDCRARLVAMVVAVAVVAGAAWSYQRLDQHADAERPVPLPEGRAELATVRADPIWGALPAVGDTAVGQYSAERTAWGERTSTGMWRRLVTPDDRDVFRRSVAAAEASGWRLLETSCYEGIWKARFLKALQIGPARLLVELTTPTHVYIGVSVDQALPAQAREGRQGRCWEP